MDSPVANQVAYFSSKGQTRASADLLKPDLTAPGYRIGAAGFGNQDDANLFWYHYADWERVTTFTEMSGTSMAAPHVAGLAAVIKSAHPTWSPMAIKSALMTTGTDIVGLSGFTTEVGMVSPTSLDALRSGGAGYVHGDAAVDPGLAFDAGPADWNAMLCGQKNLPPSVCTSLGAGITPMAVKDLNQASIRLGAMPGTQTVTRHITNVSAGQGSFTLSARGLEGFNASMSPATVSLAPGETKAVQISFTRTSAAADGGQAAGFLTLNGGRSAAGKAYAVRMPVVLANTAVLEPGSVVVKTGDKPSVAATAGYSGALALKPSTLAPMQTQPIFPDAVVQSQVYVGGGLTLTADVFPTVQFNGVQVMEAGLSGMRLSISDLYGKPLGFAAAMEVWEQDQVTGKYEFIGRLSNSDKGTDSAAYGYANLDIPARPDRTGRRYFYVTVDTDIVNHTKAVPLYVWNVGAATKPGQPAAVQMRASAPTTVTQGAPFTVKLTPGAVAANTWYVGTVNYAQDAAAAPFARTTFVTVGPLPAATK